jgi:hypothetical protein
MLSGECCGDEHKSIAEKAPKVGWGRRANLDDRYYQKGKFFMAIEASA